MTPLTGIDSAAFTAFLSVTLAVIVWAVLWTARSASVHLWCGANLVSAVFVGLLVLLVVEPGSPRHVMLPVIATAGVLSGALRAQALALLRGRSLGVAVPMVLLSAMNVMAVVAAWHPVGQAVFDLALAVTVLMLFGVGAWFALSLAREQRLLAGYLLAATLGLPAVVGLLLAFAVAMTGAEILRVSPAPVPAAVVGMNAFITSCNAALFIGIVLELLARKNVAAATALAEERSARVRLAERARIMEELHDGFGSRLSTARLRAGTGALTQPELVSLLGECQGDLHLVVDTFNDANGRLGDALRFLRLRMHDRLVGSTVKLTWSLHVDEVPPIDPATLVQLLRVIQEALNTALTHAGASEIHAAASATPTTLRFAVTDDGSGFRGGVPDGEGVRTMRERAEALGGQLTIANAGRGTTVELVVPL